MMMRRMSTVAASTAALLLLSATGAAAHECYNASRSATGNAHAVNGALVSYDELLLELCPAGAALVSAAVEANDFDSEGILVNPNALQGAHKQATDGHAIDYLPGWLSETIGAAFGTCFGG